ncbi:MAG TPA: chorismate mutase, partial [Candidatus Thermoplasmatota archaeon]|nr:chorismate mutase [Candidatus Thermoplasmatota archaeon]
MATRDPDARLRALRREIRELDARTLRLVRARLDRARRVGQEKRRRGLPLRNYQVEAEVIRDARRECRRLGLPDELGDELMRLLIRASVKEQEP